MVALNLGFEALTDGLWNEVHYPFCRLHNLAPCASHRVDDDLDGPRPIDFHPAETYDAAIRLGAQSIDHANQLGERRRGHLLHLATAMNLHSFLSGADADRHVLVRRAAGDERA